MHHIATRLPSANESVADRITLPPRRRSEEGRRHWSFFTFLLVWCAYDIDDMVSASGKKIQVEAPVISDLALCVQLQAPGGARTQTLAHRFILFRRTYVCGRSPAAPPPALLRGLRRKETEREREREGRDTAPLCLARRDRRGESPGKPPDLLMSKEFGVGGRDQENNMNRQPRTASHDSAATTCHFRQPPPFTRPQEASVSGRLRGAVRQEADSDPNLKGKIKCALVHPLVILLKVTFHNHADPDKASEKKNALHLQTEAMFQF
ncbi:hypothetical protein F2P81_021468 [Scophthalmus maximus]|uniref:Uncharacterized protein n=1 Tax=Scophthalmus maximus TaxID=52904 RepID=A0A6A4S6G6_SCOMX|nr:hypothetical protein F2P81_021468 [Scophthalmus maximus]